MTRLTILALSLTCVTIVFLCSQSTVNAVRCTVSYYDRRSRWPEFVKCVGNGTEGEWYKRENHTTYRLLARFNRTNRDIFDDNYEFWTFITNNENETGSFIDFPPGTHGRFTFVMGNETKHNNIPTVLRASGYTRETSLRMACAPPPLPNIRSRRSITSDTQRPRLVIYPPFNITWSINGSFVGRSLNCNGTTCERVRYATNITIPGLINITIEGNTATTNNSLPICLKCRVVLGNGDFGSNSVCTEGTSDVTIRCRNRVGLYGGNAGTLKGEKPDTDPSGATDVGTGATLAGSVMIVCAVAAALYIITGMRKQRRLPNSGSKQKIYKPITTDPDRVAESSAV